MAQHLFKAVDSLADTFIYSAIYGYSQRVGAKYLIDDGRARPRVWRELVSGGYLLNPTPGPMGSETTADNARKAFDELPPAVDFKLANLYKFDRWDDDKRHGRAFVNWDNLTKIEKASVIRAIELDPNAYTFSAYSRFDESKFEAFTLGNGRKAVDKIGYHDAVIAVTDTGVQDKRNGLARDLYREECEESGLNWFLNKHKVIKSKSGQIVPLAPKQPSILSSGPTLSRKPSDWASGVPQTIRAIEEKVAKLNETRDLLVRMTNLATEFGGWGEFLRQYNAAIDSYVESKFQPVGVSQPVPVPGEAE